MALLSAEPAGLAIDGRTNTLSVKDPTNPSNKRINVPISSWLTTTRAQVGWYFDANGILVQAAINTIRIGYDPITRAPLGILCEATRSNRALWCRDLTNAVWTASNVTAAKDQIGLDGIANSASSILATGAGGTVLQAITAGSGAVYQSAFVKRLVGTGTLEMTTDNGSTWTAVTPTGTGWNVAEIPTQTLANPTVGFRIGTSGDKFAVDLVQNENGAVRSSPILTTTALVSRGLDLHTVALTAFPFSATVGTIYVEGISYGLNTEQRTWFQISDATNNERFISTLSTVGGGQFLIVDGGVNQSNVLPGTAVVGQLHRFMATWNGAGAGSAQASLDGVLGTPDAALTLPTVTTLTLGAGLSGAFPFQGTIGQFIYVPR